MSKTKPNNKKSILLWLSIISLILFLLIILLINLELTNGIDQNISSFFNSNQVNTLMFIFVFITSLGSFVGLIIMGAIVLIYFYLLNKFRELKLIIILSLLTFLIVHFIKQIIFRVRPINPFKIQYSFPSAHSAVSIVFFGFLVVFFWNKKKYVSYLFGLLILLIGFSRIYLNVHWLTDVIGGYLIGIAILLFGLYFFNKK